MSSPGFSIVNFNQRLDIHLPKARIAAHARTRALCARVIGERTAITLEGRTSPSGIRQRNGHIGVPRGFDNPGPHDQRLTATHASGEFGSVPAHRSAHARTRALCARVIGKRTAITLEGLMSPSGIRRRNGHIGVPREWPTRPAIDRDAYHRLQIFSGWWSDRPSCLRSPL